MKPTILQGDVRETLRSLPSDSVHCVVTSPPYWALRSYLPKDHPLKPLEIGSEPTPEAFIQTMVEVFREVRRVLHPSGTCWVNLGDSYAHSGACGGGSPVDVRKKEYGRKGNASDAFKGREADRERQEEMDRGIPPGLKPKDLCLIPERLAIALQADGWWVRSRIAWCKKSPMPESVTDRPTSAWEHIWMLTKSSRYFWDAEAVRQPAIHEGETRVTTAKGFDGQAAGLGIKPSGNAKPGSVVTITGCNLRNFWLLGPEPYSEAHFATYPTEIPRRAILAGTSARGCCPKCLSPWERVVERKPTTCRDTPYDPKRPDGMKMRGTQFLDGETRTTGWRPTCECYGTEPLPEYPDEPENKEDREYILACDAVTLKRNRLLKEWQALPSDPCTVLDPFGGSGTTAAVAIELGRKAILCELNPEYIPMIESRTRVTAGLLLA